MTDIAIRVENCILSGVEGLSKLYPAVAPRACPESSEGARHLGRAQQRHDTLRDALVAVFRRQASGVRRQASGDRRQETGVRRQALGNRTH